jgi:hypothetical protein
MSSIAPIEVVIAIVITFLGLLAVRPIMNWLLMKLYNLFIGRNHI